MAIDSYMAFKDSAGNWLKAESQVDMSKSTESLWTSAPKPDDGCLFEVEEYNFDVEQTLNLSSQSSGAGAGKITFNPFSITRPIDKSSPTFYKMACNGSTFTNVILYLRKSLGVGASAADVSGGVFLRFDFKLVAVKTISWAHDETSPKETLSFEYGALMMQYAQQDPTGKLGAAIGAGWNRIRNVYDDQPATAITQI